MKIKRADQTELVIEDFSLVPWLVFFPASLFVLWKIVERQLNQPTFDMDLVWELVAFLGFFLATALFGERSLFSFRVEERRLIWSRAGLLGRKAGTVPFGQIRKALVQTGHSGRPLTWRVALLIDGGELPLSRSYQGGAKEACEEIARAIREMLEQEGDLIEESILAMIIAGNKLEAIKLAREHYGMGLTEAKRFVEELSD